MAERRIETVPRVEIHPGPRVTVGNALISVVLGLDDPLAPVIAVGADVVAQVDLARNRLEGKRRIAQPVMCAPHITPRRRLLVLLYSHVRVLLYIVLTPQRQCFSRASVAKGEALACADTCPAVLR